MKKKQWKEGYLEIGDIVIVKEGIMCPDLKDLNIEGWKGIVTEITEDEEDNLLVCIEWDDDTVKNMPKNFIDHGDEEGLDNDLMYLYVEDVKVIDD